eukprot:CAMPEP_0168288798 /NCGR_PEP_ID=MMETSP0142_2-20121227/3653_1 /TAXON_ID=44445 /ORGANISM="Pseudo-nitzschia australis, Strain 10249 10 AB" /LENGTH=762 /DNA_ID=CAMNT_0008234979 /DNA_START=326 /DNA_END=2614 /DNA_ORIENTATION=+
MGTFEAAQKAGKSEEKQVYKKKKNSGTKRQRRKDLQNSDKNKWLIQHPKIQSMDKRTQVYVKDAGLNETKAEKRQAPIDPKLDLMSAEVKFGRILASTDQRKRHAAVKKLRAYLKARSNIAEVVDGSNSNGNGSNGISGGLSELDLLKLWKALWYTLYMADKKPVQDELSKQLVKLLWCVVGTEEEDEYAGSAYLEMTEAEEEELERMDQDKEGGEDGEDGNGEDDDDDDDNDDDDYDVTLEELENTVKSEMDTGDDDEEDDDDAMQEDQEAMMELNDEEMPHCRGAHLASIFVRTFFRTIRRDWGTMDKYRIDKFYTLIRLMMHEIYEYMSVRSWNYGIVLLLNDAIFEEILKQPPNGLRYHLIDLCVEELAKVNAKAKVRLTEATFLDVLEPFFGLCQTGRNDDTVQERIMDKIMDNFLENYCVVSDKALQEEEEDIDDGDASSLIFSNVHVKTIAEFFFTLGSDPDTKDKYRKSLYDMHKKYMRRLKKIGKDVEITTDEDGNEIYDENETEQDEEGVDDVNIDNIDESIRFLEAETRGESQDGGGDDDNEDEDDDFTEEQAATKTKDAIEPEKPKKESKKKKKKRKSMELAEQRQATSTTATTTTDDGDKKSSATSNNDAEQEGKKRKKKKKRKSDPPAPAESAAAAEEEVVTITLTEQQEAKKKDRSAKKKKQQQLKEQLEEREKAEDGDAGSKRVSFGARNRAKSHKASMKALRTSEPPNTKETSPENGILRKEPRHKSKLKSPSSKKGRAKAASYF